MYALVYAPHGIVGEDGSKVLLFDKLSDAWHEMSQQVFRYVKVNDRPRDDYVIESNHATACLGDMNSPEWHIYRV